MNNHKKIMIIIILSLLAFSPLFASLVTLNWQWESNDEEVTSFRYRLNDNEWVTVDPSVTEFTLTGVDQDTSYTFEIQQSYDGINYGESAIKSYENEIAQQEPIVEEVPEVITEPVIIEEPVVPALEESVVVTEPVVIPEPVEPIVEEPVVIEEPVEPVMEEPLEPAVVEPIEEEVIEEPKPVTKLTPPSEEEARIEALDSNPWMAVEFLAGTGGKGDNVFLTSLFDPDGNYLTLRTMILPSFTFDFVYGNLITLSPKDSFNLRAGVGFNLYRLSSTNDSFIGTDIHVGLDYNRALGEKFHLTAGAGLALMFTSEDLSIGTNPNLFYGPYITIGGRYKINEIFSIVASAETRGLLSDVFTPYELTGIVRVGFTYRF